MNLGGSEIIVVIVVALMIFGPDKLPGALRTFGRVMGEVKKYQDMAKTEIEKAVNTVTAEDELEEEKPTRPIDDIATESMPEPQDTVPDNHEVVPPILDEDES